MAENQAKIAGNFELKSVWLYSYDRLKKVEIRALIRGFTIIESMSKPSVRGSTTVFDGIDIMSTMPLRGEELIEFTYVDFYGEERTDIFFVYAITDVKYPDANNPSIMQYTLNYVSIPKMLSDSSRIMQAFNSKNGEGLISKYAEIVYDRYYRQPLERKNLTAKEILIEDSEGLQDLVIPNLTPEEAMLFFSRRAYNGVSRTQTYRFFENRDKYYFITNDEVEALARTNNELPASVYTWNYLSSSSAEDQQTIQKTLINIDFKDKVNTANDIREGAYKKQMFEIDLWSGTLIGLPEFNFLNDFYSDTTEAIHSNNFISENIDNKYRRFILKDWASANISSGPEVRNNTYMSDLYTIKNTYMYHYRQNSINVSVYGNNKVFAGSIVQLNLFQRKVGVNDPQIDSERAGLYFVETIENVFLENKYVQNMTLSRYGNGSKNADTSTLPTTVPAPTVYSTPVTGQQ